jgi:hypothetical protein
MRVVIRQKLVELPHFEDSESLKTVDLPNCKMTASGEPLIVGVDHGITGNWARITYLVDVNFDDVSMIDSAEELKDAARLMHKGLCVFNHADQCGWFYEMNGDIDLWSGNSHDKWLRKAIDMVSGGTPAGDIIRVFKAYAVTTAKRI